MRRLIVLLFIVLLIGVSCKKNVNEEETLLETLDISDCADADKDTCCSNKCKEFCTSNGKVYSKHIINGDHCPCWCD